MLSKKFTKAKKSVQNLFSNKVDVLQPQKELNYFDIVPIDLLITIFNNLELTDVMNCENLSQQTEEAAASYYRRRFSTFDFNSSSLSTVACCSDQDHKSNLCFAKIMFRVIGPYIQTLRINYRSFHIDWVRPLSKMIHKYCKSLTFVRIYGIQGHRIKMVNTQNVKQIHIDDCLFDKQQTSSKVLILYYRSRKNSATTDIVEIIREHPYITHLYFDMNRIETAQLKSIASLQFLKTLLFIINRVATDEEVQMQKSIDYPAFMKDLQILSKLRYVEFIIPFNARLSNAIVDTSVKSLRRKCTVFLTTMVDNLEPEHIHSLQADLDGLDGVDFCNKFIQKNLLTSLLWCVRLKVLRIFFCYRKGEFLILQIEEVLAALVESVRNERCCLQNVQLISLEPVGVEYLPHIVEILKTAKQLILFRLLGCTPELIKREASVMRITQNVLVIFD